MSYIQQTLGKSEDILYQAKFHWIFWLVAWLSFAAFLGLAGYFIVGLLEGASVGRQSLVIIALLFLAYLVWHNLIYLWSTKIAVTNHRLIVKKGVLARHTDEIRLKAIEEVNFHESLLGRLFGYGKVIVHGTGVDDITVSMISHPVIMVQAIENATNHEKVKT